MSDKRERIIEAMLTLLADRPYEEVTLRAIAERAGVSLAELSEVFASRLAILSAFTRGIDQAVLAEDFSDMADQPARERLFDVLMSRLEALRPHRGAIAGLIRAVRRDPQLGLAMNAIAVRSQAWMLSAAGIVPTGWRGRLATQGLSTTFLRVLRVFVEEDDPGMPRTMAALDRELREAERRHARFARLFGEAVMVEPAIRQAQRDAADRAAVEEVAGAAFADGPTAVVDPEPTMPANDDAAAGAAADRIDEAPPTLSETPGEAGTAPLPEPAPDPARPMRQDGEADQGGSQRDGPSERDGLLDDGTDPFGRR